MPAVASTRRLLAVFAHPDDEIAVAPLLARYAAEGDTVRIACVTSGRNKAAEPCVMAVAIVGAVRERR